MRSWLYIVYAIAHYNIPCLWHYMYFYLHIYVRVIYNYMCVLHIIIYVCARAHVFCRKTNRRPQNIHTKSPLCICWSMLLTNKKPTWNCAVSTLRESVFVEETPAPCTHPSHVGMRAADAAMARAVTYANWWGAKCTLSVCRKAFPAVSSLLLVKLSRISLRHGFLTA